MPILRFRTQKGDLVHRPLERRASPGDSLLTIGEAPDEPNHIHVSMGSGPARIVGSHVSNAYAFVLGAANLLVNGRSMPLRVLRHGDHFSVGKTEFVYLDFFFQSVPPGSGLVGQNCSLGS